MALGKLGARGGFGSGGALGKAGRPAAPLFRPISSRGNINIASTNATSGSNLTVKSRSPWPISAQGGGIVKVKAVFLNWKAVAGGSPFAQVGANAIPIQKASLEWNGHVTPLTVAGSRSFSIPASLQPFETDLIDVPTGLGVSAITSAAFAYTRVLGTFTLGQTFPSFTAQVEDIGYRYNKDSGGTNVNLSDDIDATGVMAAPTGATLGFTFAPALLVGYFANGDSVPFFSLGDSKAQGSNDVPSVTNGYGFLRRMAVAAGVAHFGFSIGGRNTTDWIGGDHTAESAIMQKYLKGGICVHQVGFNRLGSVGVFPINDNITTRSDITTIASVKEIWQATHGPKVGTSTSKWADTANQTVTNQAFLSGNECDQTNANYIANVGVAGQFLTGVIDESTPIRDGTDPTKFKVRNSFAISTGGYTGGATTITLDTQPTVGAWLIPLNGTTPDAAGARRANSVSGTGPFVVSLGSSSTVAAGFTSSYIAGVPCKEVSCIDGIHEMDLVHADIVAANSSFYTGLVGKGVY